MSIRSIPSRRSRRSLSRTVARGLVLVTALPMALALPAVARADTAKPSVNASADSAQGSAGASVTDPARNALVDATRLAGSLASGDPTVDLVGADEIAGSIAVDLRDDVTSSDIADIGKAYGITLRPNSPWSDTTDKLEIADVPPEAEDALLARLSRDPRVEHAERMTVFRASFVPNDPLYGEKQWHLKKAGAEQAWDYACGQGVTVAVVDTGVACYDKGPFSKGTDLAGTRCGGGFNFVDDTPEAVDDQGHGTHVAGTIAQTTNNGVGVAGMAYCANLMPVKVLNKFGWGTLADVAEGIRFAADHGAQVINLSLGGPGKASILEDAVVHAHKKGVLIVAAAGNSGRSVGYPAAYDGVIAVSATDSNDNIAWFSSRGPQIAIGAPGVGVTQQTICEGGKNKCEVFGTLSGTSMASPHVAGAAALVVGLGVTDPASVKRALMASARPNGDPKLFGAGVLDAGAATSHVFWSHVMFRGLALLAIFFAVASRIKKLGGKPSTSFGTVVGALVASVGLLPVLPLAGALSHTGRFRWVAELAMRPFGEWDIALSGVALHSWLPLASAIPTMALTAFLFGSKRARPALGGFAVGSAALLVQLAVQADVAFPLGGVALRVLAVANALVCVWIARISLDKRTA